VAPPLLVSLAQSRYFFSGFVTPHFVARGVLSAAGPKKTSLRPAASLLTLLIFYNRVSLSVVDGVAEGFRS
jgi:hypothetical protein